jgi:hypothetical protein
MDAQMLTALLQAWQQQAIAFDDLVYAMKQGEIVREERTAEEIEEENQDRVPSMGALGGGGFGAE